MNFLNHSDSWPALAVNKVFIWVQHLDALFPKINMLYDCLTDDEKTRANRFAFEKHRMRFIGARVGLRKLLSYYLREPALTIAIEAGVYGKPYIVDSQAVGLQFNLAHANDYAIYAFTKGYPLGVDLESESQKIDKQGIAKRILTEKEYRYWNEKSHDEKWRLFYQAWVRKESAVKALGQGLHYPLSKFEIDLGQAGMRKITLDGRCGYLQDLAILPGFQSSLTVLDAVHPFEILICQS